MQNADFECGTKEQSREREQQKASIPLPVFTPLQRELTRVVIFPKHSRMKTGQKTVTKGLTGRKSATATFYRELPPLTLGIPDSPPGRGWI